MKNLTIKFLFALLIFAAPSQAAYYHHASPAVTVVSPGVQTVSLSPGDNKPAAAGSGWQSIVSFVAGVGGLVAAAIPFGIVAIVFGVLGVTGPKKLRGLGIAGIILGTIDLVVGLLVVAMMAG